MKLSQAEFKRYGRHIIIKEIGIKGQLKLKQAKVLVIGAGALGCPILQYLNAAGVGEIGIADFDVVEESNLHRQILYNTEDIGKPKVEVAAKKLSIQNPFVKHNIYNTKISKENALEIIKDYDLVIDGCDNFPTRYLVNDSCVILDKPFVFGAVYQFEGQVSVFNYKGGPTYRCLFPDMPEVDDAPTCSDIGVLGIIPGIIGNFEANEALKIILELGDVMSGKLLTFDALSLDFNFFNFNKNEKNAQIKTLDDYDYYCESDIKIKEMSVIELKQLIDKKEKVQLIDIREKDEFSISNIGGMLIPMENVFNDIEIFDKNNPVVFICRNGNRSRFVVKLLQQTFNFENFYNLKGGVNEWADKIDNTMTKY